MPTFCVSDLHLADRGPRDNFAAAGREERFYKFLEFVVENRGALYILGDLFDWWQVNLSKSVLAYADLLERLAAMGATYVVGNHDLALANFIGTEWMPDWPCVTGSLPAFEETLGGRHFAFLHGHEADSYCHSDNPGTGEITAIISGLLEDRNRGPFDGKRHAVEDKFIAVLESAANVWRYLTGQHGRREEVLRGVEAYRHQRKADVVVYGHTHEPGRIGDFHYNCGCWCRMRDTFERIEDNGAANVWEWTQENQAVPYDEELRPT